MKNNKGVISVFVWLAMMFFLIFIMVAYNNVSQKGKSQVETEGILVEYYQSIQNADEIVIALDGGNVTSETKEKLLKETAQQQIIDDRLDMGCYIYSNGKIYYIPVS